ncbi:TPA: hypothetical protein R6P06_001283 [Enterococcus faecalis]|nr:hypothetical protein [Enterococcus faecalis]MCB8498852.1 hypothetical protein [Enterococcus faecalis]MCB8517250.1 hypothetical protein [Enterococcus faecalis]PQE72385.1 hypothetical protein CUT01_03265 [Enterococcus faecalis]PQF04014.1 hypothetical protein CUT03_10355 [Enterococcus faecalis]
MICFCCAWSQWKHIVLIGGEKMKKTVRLLLVGYVEWTVEERYQSCLGNNIVSIRQLFKKVQAPITYRNTTKICKK